MGTGSTRKRNISKYEQYRSGGGTTALAPTSYVNSQVDPNWGANQAGVAPYPTSEVDQNWEANRAGRPITIPNSEVDPNWAANKKAGDAWNAAADYASGFAGHAPPKPLTANEKLNAWFNANYADPTADITKAYKAQEAAINGQYDRLLGRLGTEHGAAERGVRAEGQAVQNQLAAIGADGAAALAASNSQIDKDYADALKGINADYKPLAADIKKSGGDTSGLRETAVQGRTDLREGHVSDAALGQRYQQLLTQSINDRKATGATVTAAGVNDLARILQQSRDTASTDRLAAVAKVEANMAGDLAQAKDQRNKAKYSLFLDVLKSGGTLGQAAFKIATPGTINSAIKTLQSGNVDYSKSFSGLTKSQNPDEVKLGQGYQEALINGSKTPDQVWAEWQANPNRTDMPLLSDAIMQMMSYGQALKVDPATLKRYLAETGYKLKTTK